MTKSYRAAFNTQRNNAKARGVQWELTFEQWVEFWGDDIDKRGRGRMSLQMQRVADSGPYAIGNIRKGVPKQNSATYSAVLANKRSTRAAKAHQAYLDSLMFAPSAPDKEDDPALDEESTANIYGNRIKTGFPASWQFAATDGRGSA